jgi:hypothetical protein
VKLGRGKPIAVAALALLALVLPVASAQAVSPIPAWRVESLPLPTNFVPGDEGHAYYYEVRVVDITAAPLATGLVTIADTLPAGLDVKSVALKLPVIGTLAGGSTVEGASLCETTTEGDVQTVTCKVPSKFEGEPILREAMTLRIVVSTPPGMEGTELTNVARVQGAGATPASITSHNLASSEIAPSGLARLDTELIGPDGSPATQAGSHPFEFVTSFELNTENGPFGSPIPARGDLRDIHVTLPPGFIGDPTATVYCDPQAFSEVVVDANLLVNGCPRGSVVGLIDAVAENGTRLSSPVFNLTPPPGMPALLGLQVGGFSFYVETRLGPGPDHPILADLSNLTEIERPIASRLTLWGTPGESNHDALRGGECLANTGASLGICASGLPLKPFLRLPTSCESSLSTKMSFDTWDNPGLLLGATSVLPAPSGCAQLSFAPTITVRPQVSVADSPTGVSVNLHIPQNEDPEQLASADLRNATVELPEGLTVNPASAGGLAACSPAQIDLNSTTSPGCPDASKVGAVEVTTPLLDHVAKGSIYLASQNDNPFQSLLAIYLVVDDPQSGVVLKLAGEVKPDPQTGQLTTTFTNNPQVPFEDLHVEFFNGPHAPLRMPPTCGAYTTSTDLRPWSAPESGPDATLQDSFSVSSGPGGPCPTGELAPKLSAGVSTPIAGAFTPFSLRVFRADGTDELSALTASPPRGVLAKLKGIPYCPEASIEQAQARSKPGAGALEAASPSCPAAAEVGSVQAGAGAGPDPFYVSGKLYLAGPYKGAPISLVAVIPAVAGPFDLGTVVDRVALQIDPETAQVRSVSDPFPTILSGIPVDVRDLRVHLDRPGFTVAPTSCREKTVEATIFGVHGGSATASNRFQVGACQALGFAPSLSLRLKGGTRRTSHPALRATLKARPGDANIARTEVILPSALFIDPIHVNNPCTRVQFAASKCPKGSVLGKARASTPLLDKPLEGPVYFRSNGGERDLPDIVADLHGQIHITLVGFIDSVQKKGSEVARLRTTFANVPDAPVSKFVLQLKGGKQGLLQLSRNICKADSRVTVKMRAQNGRGRDFQQPLRTGCKNK